MTESEIIEEAKLIILACEYAKRDTDQEYSKVSDELTAYRQLKELIIEEDI